MSGVFVPNWVDRGCRSQARVLAIVCFTEVAWAVVLSLGQGSSRLALYGYWGAHIEPLSERCGFGRVPGAFVFKVNRLLVAQIHISINLQALRSLPRP